MTIETKKPTPKKARAAGAHSVDAEQSKTKKAPWEKKNPKKGAAKKKLTEKQKDEARARAKKAGRPYPNLVDNMAVARKSSGKPKSK